MPSCTFHSSASRAALRAVLSFAFLAVAYPLAAQGGSQLLDGPRFGIGYAANAPEVMGGGMAYVVLPALGGIGIYLDTKFDTDSPSKGPDFEAGLTAGDVVDQVSGADFIEREASWRSFNVAVIRPINPSLMVYGGVGYSKAKQYHLYEAPLSGLGRAGGVFWVKAPLENEKKANVVVGVLLRLTSIISTQFGYETSPKGLTFGASLRLPRW